MTFTSSCIRDVTKTPCKWPNRKASKSLLSLIFFTICILSGSVFHTKKYGCVNDQVYNYEKKEYKFFSRFNYLLIYFHVRWKKWQKEMRPTYWLVGIREDGNLEIYTLPDFRLSYVVKNFWMGKIICFL